MIVADVSVHSVHAPIEVPYTIAYETITEVTNHFVVITLRDGRQGIGCAAPAPEVTGETVEASREALDTFARNALRYALDELPLPDHSCPSARAAIDLARHDLLARARNTSIGGLFGYASAAVEPRETSITIGISSLQETLTQVERLHKRGFAFFKVKGGHNVNLDIERLKVLRDRYGPKIRLALDANQGYDLAGVERLQKGAFSLGLQYVEQPTTKKNLLLLGEAARRTAIPVMADESVQTADDVSRIAEAGPVALINIKLQKMGGLEAAHAIDSRAKEAGMETMLGCMDESALSIAAALHFGATHDNVRFLDLDGHLDLSEDPFAHLVRLDGRGRLFVAPGVGLGWKRSPFGEGRS